MAEGDTSPQRGEVGSSRAGGSIRVRGRRDRHLLRSPLTLSLSPPGKGTNTSSACRHLLYGGNAYSCRSASIGIEAGGAAGGEIAEDDADRGREQEGDGDDASGR